MNWCLKFHDNGKSFDDAVNHCQTEGARLVIPNTETKHRYIVDNYLENKYLGRKNGHRIVTKCSIIYTYTFRNYLCIAVNSHETVTSLFLAVNE